MKKQKLLVLAMTALIFTSCGGFSKIEVGDVQSIKIAGLENNALIVNVKLPINNPSAYKITVIELDSKVYVNNKYLGQINSAEKVVLPSKTKDVYDLELSVRVANFFGAALSMMNLKPGQRISVRMEGTVKARSLLISKSIPFEESQEVVL